MWISQLIKDLGEVRELTVLRPKKLQLDGCTVWNAHNTVLGEEALLIYIVPVCYVKTGRYGKPSNIIISLHRKKINYCEYCTNY